MLRKIEKNAQGNHLLVATYTPEWTDDWMEGGWFKNTLPCASVVINFIIIVDSRLQARVGKGGYGGGCGDRKQDSSLRWHMMTVGDARPGRGNHQCYLHCNHPLRCHCVNIKLPAFT